jgi:hypothetical protein
VLTVECAPGPIAHARGDIAVVPVFSSDRPLRGSAGHADWRLCGRLSELIASGRLTGRPGEAVLMPAGGGLRVPVLLAIGLGPREDFRARSHELLAREAVRRGLELGAETIALPFLGAELGEPALGRCAAALIAGAARVLADGNADLCLRVVAPREEAARAEEALGRARPRALPRSVRLQRPRPRAARPPRLARTAQQNP